MQSCPCGSQKKALDLLELEIQVVGDHLIVCVRVGDLGEECHCEHQGLKSDDPHEA